MGEKMKERRTVKEILRKWVSFFLNPRLLLCLGLAWMITNGWCYVFIAVGTWLKISWMLAVGAAYASFLWFPMTPEKLITLFLAIFFLKRLFPKDEKTLKILHEKRQQLKNAIAKKRQEKKDDRIHSKAS